MSSPALSPTAKKNVETIAKVEQQLAGRRTRMDRIGDAIARFFGTLRFIVAHALFLTGWIVVNLGLFLDVQSFDPYPFPFLGLIVGIEFIFLTTGTEREKSASCERLESAAQLSMMGAPFSSLSSVNSKTVSFLVSFPVFFPPSAAAARSVLVALAAENFLECHESLFSPGPCSPAATVLFCT
jgi:Protein of unknown function (DUF1003)